MGILDRFRSGDDSAPTSARVAQSEPAGSYDAAGDAEEELPLRPRYAPLEVATWEEVKATISALEAEGVDLDDLDSIAALYERELTAWEALSKRDRPNHAPIVYKVAVAIGEYLVRHTDMRWFWVTDAFGSALSVAAQYDDFVVVPRDLVGVRWLSRSRGWVTGVVGHMERVRRSRGPR
jgi:uncharacterized protein DUF3806